MRARPRPASAAADRPEIATRRPPQPALGDVRVQRRPAEADALSAPAAHTPSAVVAIPPAAGAGALPADGLFDGRG